MVVRGRGQENTAEVLSDELGETLGVEELRAALEEMREELAKAEGRKTRAIARATGELRKENEVLEAHLTQMVQEIGQLRFATDRVAHLEREGRTLERRIEELEAELERLRTALDGGRPTALAAASASQAARLFGKKRSS